MTEEKLQYFKKRLDDERESLLSQISELETPVDFEDVPGDEDETGEAEEFANRTASAGVLRVQLGEIESALIRIENGTYGACEKTGKEIPLEALEINTTLRFHPDVMKEINEQRQI